MRVKVIGYVVTFVGLLAAAALARGYVLLAFYDWFVRDTFGAPRINLAEAVGLGLLVGFLAFQDSQPDRETKEILVRSVAMIVLYYPLVYAIGALVHAL